ncbi:MAG: YjbQ family protein [Desulfobacteraceae bacterium]|nr:MAG: YjbQ family protein [Desulfobacteraceae bacterium]
MILTVTTRTRTELIDITAAVRRAVAASGVQEGLCLVAAPHTTAGITVNEAADPSVPADILMVLNRMVPWEADYRHREGNSPAHVKSTLVGSSQALAVENGDLVLGTWQGVFFCEFDGPRRRSVQVRVLAGRWA